MNWGERLQSGIASIKGVFGSRSDSNLAYRRSIQEAHSAFIQGAVGGDGELTYTGDVTSADMRNAVVKPFMPMWLYRPLYGRPRNINIPEIRRLAKSPTAAACIKTVIDQVSSIDWEIVMRDEDAEDNLVAIDEVTARLDNPNRNKEDFKIFIKKWVRDMLEVDAAVTAKIFDLASYEGGNVYAKLLPLGRRKMLEFYAYDGSTFTKNPNPHGILPDQMAYFQYNFHQQSAPIPFGRDEIIFMESSPQTAQMYGVSPMEMCYDVVRYIVYGITSGIDHFTNNEVPKGILSIIEAEGDTIEEFQGRLADRVMIQDPITNEKRYLSSKIPITNSEVKWTQLSLTPEVLKLLETQKWYTNMVWSCYDEDTELLTENGFKQFKDLEDGEKVAQVCKDNLEITFVEPTDYQTYDYDGDLTYYKTRSLDLAVTPEHRMLMIDDNKFFNNDYEWVVKEAKDFNRGVIPQAGIWTGEHIDDMHFSIEDCGGRNKDTYTFDVDGDLFCKFMGIWLSDGWVDSSNGRICLCASEVYPENIKVIEELLCDMGVDYHKFESKPRANLHTTRLSENSMFNYRFSNRAFHSYLKQFGHARDKFVPSVIRNSDKTQINLFLEYFMYGDGSKGGYGRNDRYGSMSKELLNGLQEMLIKTGKSCTLTQNISNGCWELGVRKTKTDKIDSKFYSVIKPNNVEVKNYCGKVYDVTVPEHFLVVRRNGRVSISGNCFGVTPNEMGYIEDSNKSSEIGQSKVFKRKTVMPILDTLEYFINMELIPEFGYDDVCFRFIRADLDQEKDKQELWDGWLKNGQRTVNEWRSEYDLEPVEWGDEPYTGSSFGMGDSRFENPFEEGGDVAEEGG